MGTKRGRSEPSFERLRFKRIKREETHRRAGSRLEQTLPEDVLVRILSFLTAAELANVSLVSKGWARLAREGSLWKHLYLTTFASRTRADWSSFPNRPWRDLFKISSNWRKGTARSASVSHQIREAVLPSVPSETAIESSPTRPIPPPPTASTGRDDTLVQFHQHYYLTASRRSRHVLLYCTKPNGDTVLLRTVASRSDSGNVTELRLDERGSLLFVGYQQTFSLYDIVLGEEPVIVEYPNVDSTLLRRTAGIMLSTLKDDMLATISQSFTIRFWKVDRRKRGVSEVGHAFKSSQQFCPVFLSLDPLLPSEKSGFTVMLAFSTPVYPTMHWTIGIQRFVVSSSSPTVETSHIIASPPSSSDPSSSFAGCSSNGLVTSLSVSGSVLIASRDNNTIDLYSIERDDLKHRTTLFGHTSSVRDVALKDDRAVSVAQDGWRMWDNQFGTVEIAARRENVKRVWFDDEKIVGLVQDEDGQTKPSTNDSCRKVSFSVDFETTGMVTPVKKPLISRPLVSRPVTGPSAPSTPVQTPTPAPSRNGGVQPASLLRKAIGNSTKQAATADNKIVPGFEAQEDFISFDDDDQDGENDQDRHGAGSATPSSREGTPRSARSDRKRKRESMMFGSDVEGSRKVRLREAQRSTPWSAGVDWDSEKHPTRLLNEEAECFMRYISPTTKEHEMRIWTIELVRRAVTKKWPNANVECFGSVGTGLYLPGGDIDLVILCNDMPAPPRKPTSSLLHRIAALLLTTSLAEPSSLIVIAKARVPIVKFTSRFGGFSVDISINQRSGIDTAIMVRKLLSDYSFVPEDGDHVVGVARSLTMMVKMFLNQRGLNEVFTGGLGSYAIICMVISFLQLHPKVQTGSIDPSANLGLLFLEFLELYGKHFNYDDVGITIKGRGGYFSKDDRGWLNHQRRFALSIEDPNDPTNDISAGSFNILQVRGTLAGAFDVLSATVLHRVSLQTARENDDSTMALSDEVLPNADSSSPDDPERRSILGSVIGLTAASIRHRRANEDLYDAQVLQKLLLAGGGRLPNGSVPIVPTDDSITAPDTSATAIAYPVEEGNEIAPVLTKKERKQAKQKAKKLAKKEARKAKKMRRRAEKLELEQMAAPENMKYVAGDSSGSEHDDDDDDDEDDSDADDAQGARAGSDSEEAEQGELTPLASARDDAGEEESRYSIGRQSNKGSATSSRAASAALGPDSSDGDEDDDDFVLGGAQGDQLTSKSFVSSSFPSMEPGESQDTPEVAEKRKSPSKKPGKKERAALKQKKNDYWASKGTIVLDD